MSTGSVPDHSPEHFYTVLWREGAVHTRLRETERLIMAYPEATIAALESVMRSQGRISTQEAIEVMRLRVGGATPAVPGSNPIEDAQVLDQLDHYFRWAVRHAPSPSGATNLKRRRVAHPFLAFDEVGPDEQRYLARAAQRLVRAGRAHALVARDNPALNMVEEIYGGRNVEDKLAAFLRSGVGVLRGVLAIVPSTLPLHLILEEWLEEHPPAMGVVTAEQVLGMLKTVEQMLGDSQKVGDRELAAALVLEARRDYARFDASCLNFLLGPLVNYAYATAQNPRCLEDLQLKFVKRFPKFFQVLLETLPSEGALARVTDAERAHLEGRDAKLDMAAWLEAVTRLRMTKAALCDERIPTDLRPRKKD